MLEFTYIAKRSLKAGVTAGDTIVLSLNGSQQPASEDLNRSGSPSLGGRTQYNLLSSKKTWSVEISKTSGVTYEDLLMFTQSVKGGELFDYTDVDSGLGYVVQTTSLHSNERFVRYITQDFKYTLNFKEA